MKYLIFALTAVATSVLAAPGVIPKRDCYDDCFGTCLAFTCTGNDFGFCPTACNAECNHKCKG